MYIQLWQIGDWNQQNIHFKAYLDNNSPQERRKRKIFFFKIQSVRWDLNPRMYQTKIWPGSTRHGRKIVHKAVDITYRPRQYYESRTYNTEVDGFWTTHCPLYMIILMQTFDKCRILIQYASFDTLKAKICRLYPA